MAQVKFTDGRKVDVIDADCEFRPCFVFGFNKGPFTPGVGYTRPETPHRPVCLTRDVHGCPHKDPGEEHVLKCNGCGRAIGRRSGPAVDQDEPCQNDYAGRVCGETGTYRLAVLLDPLPCCAAPRVPRNPRARSQRCLSCGARLTGLRLERARAA